LFERRYDDSHLINLHAKLIRWQHFFGALLYGVHCLKPVVVPVPLAPNDSERLWNYSVWLTDGTHADDGEIRTKDFIQCHQGKRMHCFIYYVRQETETYILPQNHHLSDESRKWFGNVLVAWANNDWPEKLRPKLDTLRDVIY
jgi:hypothetical protein